MRSAHVGAIKRARVIKITPANSNKMIVPTVERPAADGAQGCWVLTLIGEPVACLEPTQQIRAIAAGDEVVWTVDQDDPDPRLGVRYRIVELRAVTA